MSQALLQPVLFGGLFMGVLSALPIISIGNCCCLWVTGGGVVTAYLTQHGRSDSIQLGEGAVGGFLSGIVGAVVYAVLALPIQLVTAPLQRGMLDGLLESAADVPPEVREMLESLGSGSGVGVVLVGICLDACPGHGLLHPRGAAWRPNFSSHSSRRACRRRGTSMNKTVSGDVYGQGDPRDRGLGSPSRR